MGRLSITKDNKQSISQYIQMEESVGVLRTELESLCMKNAYPKSRKHKS